MLRTFLISTVIASILILLTTFTTHAEAASVVTTTTTPILTTTTAAIAPLPPAAIVSNNSATVFQLSKTSVVVNRFLNNAAEETTTSLLPLQPPLNVTSTTLASFILNQKHQQQQRERKQLQQLYLQKQRQQRQLQDVAETVTHQQPQTQKHSLNVNDNKDIKKKNLDAAFVTVKSAVDVIDAEPSSTHAYIPFELDYNDPTEEKAAPQGSARQSTINEVLTNLFPKGFSDIFRFSYAGEQQETTSSEPLLVIRSTPTPFKPMPNLNVSQKENPESSQKEAFITVSTTVTKEVRREISPGHTEIVVEKIITDSAASKSAEDFKDGSNSISKDDLMRINRAAKEASVLPSLLINPSNDSSSNSTQAKAHIPIVILNENNNNDDFVDAPEDDNQIAETQDVVHQVIQPPPAESTNFHVSPIQQYNVRIIHDNTLKKSQDSEAASKQPASLVRSSPSYQTFVEQSKYLQNSLQEAPSRKFLKNFQNPISTENKNVKPVSKGNFHYEQGGQQNHIQTVAPAAQLQFVRLQQTQPQAEASQKDQAQSHHFQELHTLMRGNHQHLSDNDIYQIVPDHQQPEQSTNANLVFVTINTPINHNSQQSANLMQTYSQEPQVIPAQAMKSPHEFVSEAMGYATQHLQRQQQQKQHLADHQAEQTENNPKPSNAGYTFVEVQKSINIHNKLITEKDGRLIEQHETIYPEQKYSQDHAEPEVEPQQPLPSPEYVNLSQNPIHVEQEEEQHEPAASIIEEQHALNPSQHLEDFGPIQQSNLIQESHIIEASQQHQGPLIDTQQQHDNHIVQVDLQHESQYQPENYATAHEQHPEELHHQQQQQIGVEEHLTGELLPAPQNAENVQIPYALPHQEIYHSPTPTPMVVQEILEKHIPVPYGVPEPIGIPVHIQHFIDRPFPVETIVEKPVPYPVEKVVEKVVEKHVPVEVEKIVEKPVEVIVKKYIDRPVAIPIKIPVALHLPFSASGPPPYGPASSVYPPIYGNGLDHASTWPQPVNAGTFTRIPQNVLKAYYTKMLKKLVPQMQQAFKNSHSNKGVPKITQKPYSSPKLKISDILYDLKPPPPRSSSSWDVGSRYQYDYNTLPLDLSASGSIAVGKNYERPGQSYKANYDEFQRWRNGHSLKRSPDFGRNLHMEYGFKPPLVPSIEIDDKGVPLKAVADLTKGQTE